MKWRGPGDTAEYIAHRLRRAGCERDLFNSDATALIHEQSQGRLRDTIESRPTPSSSVCVGRSRSSIASSSPAYSVTPTSSATTDITVPKRHASIKIAIVCWRSRATLAVAIAFCGLGDSRPR
jgi:hypothetical protein